MVDLAPFQLSHSQLVDIRDQFSAAIEAGLAADGQQVAALPAFLAPPPDNVAGEALVVDTGGTNMRGGVDRVDRRRRTANQSRSRDQAARRAG